MQVIGSADTGEIDPGAALDEGGLDRRAQPLGPPLDAKAEPERRQLRADRFQVGIQVECPVRSQQRKVEVFGTARQGVEDAQRGAAIERGVFEELRPPQPQQRQLLDDLRQRALVVRQGARAVAVEHPPERKIHQAALVTCSSQRRNAVTFCRR